MRKGCLMVLLIVMIFVASAFQDEDVNEDGNITVGDLMSVGYNLGLGLNGCDFATNNWCDRTDVSRDHKVNVIDIIRVGLNLSQPPEVLPGANEKDLSAYSDKEVFLISDKDWADVLQLVPMTVWTGKEGCANNRPYGGANDTCYYPTLIFHEETNSTTGASVFDADSIVWFMLRYFPNKVTIIGDTPQDLDNLLVAKGPLGAGLKLDNLQRISTSDYLSRWKYFDKVVYVANDYGIANVAAAYAALIDAPLIIKGGNYDSSGKFNGRDIVCVGTSAPSGFSCKESYSLKQLQVKYSQITQTDKIIMTNFYDIYLHSAFGHSPSYYLRRSDGNLTDIFTKDSMAAAFLAAGKKELIINTSNSGDYVKEHYAIRDLINEIAPQVINNPMSSEVGIVKLTEPEGAIQRLARSFYHTNLTSRVTEELGDIKVDFGEVKAGLIASPEFALWSELHYDDRRLQLYDFNNDEINSVAFTKKPDLNMIHFEPYDDGFVYNIVPDNSSYCRFYAFRTLNSSSSSIASYGPAPGATTTSCNEFAVQGKTLLWQVPNSNVSINATLILTNISSKSIIRRLNISTYRNPTSLGIFGNKIVFDEPISSQNDALYLYDFDTLTKKMISQKGVLVGINDNYVAWYNDSGVSIDLFLYNLTGSTTNRLERIPKDVLSYFYGGLVSYPIISNNKIVWITNQTKRCGMNMNSCNSGADCQNVCSVDHSSCGASDSSCAGGLGTCVHEPCLPSGIVQYDMNTGIRNVVDLGVLSPVGNALSLSGGNDLYYSSPKKGFDYKRGYLTIMGSNESILYLTSYNPTGGGADLAQDYADVYLDDGIPDLYFGRISGFTLSDTSSYIARDLLYDRFNHSISAVFGTQTGHPADYIVQDVADAFNRSGYNSQASLYPVSDNWKGKMISTWTGHAANGQAGISSGYIPDLNETIGFDAGCVVGSFINTDSFSSTVIRRGGIANFGGLSLGGSTPSMALIYTNFMPLGKAQFVISRNVSSGLMFNGYNYFLGDPTFEPKPSYRVEGLI